VNWSSVVSAALLAVSVGSVDDTDAVDDDDLELFFPLTRSLLLSSTVSVILCVTLYVSGSISGINERLFSV
jgi:hypothetical protein